MSLILPVIPRCVLPKEGKSMEHWTKTETESRTSQDTPPTQDAQETLRQGPGSPTQTSHEATQGAEDQAKGFKFFDKRFWATEGQWEDEEPSSDKPTYVEELERRVAEAEARLAEYIRAYKEKTEVEWAQVRQRLEREAEREVDRRVRRIVADLLEVLDNLDRTLDSARQARSLDALLEGVAMVRDQFLAKLQAQGLEPIEAQGKTFDPSEHEAAAMVSVSDPSLGGKVVDILRPGYRFQGSLLRPALVRVGHYEG